MMQTAAKHGLIIGFVTGLLVAVGFYLLTKNPWVFLLAPFAALMGMAPQLLRPADDDEDD